MPMDGVVPSSAAQHVRGGSCRTADEIGRAAGCLARPDAHLISMFGSILVLSRRGKAWGARFAKLALSARLRFALARPQSLIGSLDLRELAEVATAIAGAAGRPNEKAWFACCRLANARSRPPPSGP